MKKFKKNLKKLFAISVCTTLLTSLIFVNTNAAENNKSSKIAKSETIKSTTHLQNRSIKYRKGKRLSISGESSNSDIATSCISHRSNCCFDQVFLFHLTFFEKCHTYCIF